MLKKFDISANAYVETCDSEKFEFNDLCWDDCPYHYYRIFTNKRTCSKDEPGENFFYDSTNNIYYQCYSTCKTCNAKGSEAYHNCEQCIEEYLFINTVQDKYAITHNCYKNCEEKNYYFTLNHEYFCTDDCPTNYKLISEKNKCIDLCTNDDTYTKEYNNKCVTECPKGTADIDNICKPCYDSCEACNAIGYEEVHKCTE